MSINGLPPIDVPWWRKDPHDCLRCKHSFYQSSDRELRYPRCGRSEYAQQCRYERHETGTCGPDAIYWTERGI